MNHILTAAVGGLPSSGLKNFLLRRLGHDVHRTAQIGPNLLWRIASISAAQGSKVRGPNVIRDLRELNLGPNSSIGAWNWISAAPGFKTGDPLIGTIHLGTGAAITSRHYLDASGGISVGEFATIGGQKSTILSHGIDFKSNSQKASGIMVGSFSFVSTDCRLLAGSALPSKSVLAAGAVLTAGTDSQQSGLWGGVPARFIKPVEGRYFSRTIPFVHVDDLER